MTLSTTGAATARALVFALGPDELAVDVLSVREIIRWRKPTPIPSLPPAILGIVKLRDGVVPVFDLAMRFGRAPTVPARRTCIVVVEASIEGEPVEIGLVADDVRQVAKIVLSEVDAAPVIGGKRRLDFLSGVARVDERLVLILDVERAIASLEVVEAPSPPTAPALVPVPVPVPEVEPALEETAS